MEAYSALAAHDDALTDDVQYDAWADYAEHIFARLGVSPKLVLDLACGTGSLSLRMAQRGYEMIGVDLSPDMLAAAAEKAYAFEPERRPIFLCQDMAQLDLYGTIDAALCCLDSVNYVTDENALARAFSRVSLFLNPGGVFLFDVNTEFKLKGLDRQAFVRDTEQVYCIWQAFYNPRSRLCRYVFDLFERGEDGLYERFREEHRERAYSAEKLTSLLCQAGLTPVGVYGAFSDKAPAKDEERIFLAARKPQ